MIWVNEIEHAKGVAKVTNYAEDIDYLKGIREEREKFRTEWKKKLKGYKKQLEECRKLISEGKEPPCGWNHGVCPYEMMCEFWAED